MPILFAALFALVWAAVLIGGGAWAGGPGGRALIDLGVHGALSIAGVLAVCQIAISIAKWLEHVRNVARVKKLLEQ